MIWVLFLTFSWRFYKYNLSKSLCFEFCQFSFRVPGGAIWPGPIFWTRDGRNTFVWIYSICHTNSHLQQKSFFWEFLPQSGMKGLGRYYHPPSGVTVRERAKVWKWKFFTHSISHFAYILSIFFANFATFSSQDFFNL